MYPFSEASEVIAATMARTLHRRTNAEAYSGSGLARRFDNRFVEMFDPADPASVIDLAWNAGCDLYVTGSFAQVAKGFGELEVQLGIEWGSVRAVDAGVGQGSCRIRMLPKAFELAFGSKVQDLMSERSATNWNDHLGTGSARMLPDVDRELGLVIERLSDWAAETASLRSGDRAVVLATLNGTQACDLTHDLATSLEAKLSMNGIAVQPRIPFLKLYHGLVNRDLVSFGEVRAQRASALDDVFRRAGTDVLIELRVATLQGDRLALTLRQETPTHTRSWSCGVLETGSYAGRALAAQLRKPLPLFVPDPRAELFSAVDQTVAALLAKESVRFLLGSHNRLALGPIRTPRHEVWRICEQRLAEEIRRAHMRLVQEHGTRGDVLHLPCPIRMADVTYPDIAVARIALDEIRFERELGGGTILEKELDQHVRAGLTKYLPGVRLQSTRNEFHDIGAAMEDIGFARDAGLEVEIVAAPSLRTASYVLRFCFRNAGTVTHVRADLLCLQTYESVASAEGEVVGAQLARDVYALVDDGVEIRPRFPRPEELAHDMQPLPQRSVEEFTESLEDYVEARTGSVAMVVAGKDGSFRVFRMGTCFALELDGRNVLVTNRHVVTELANGCHVLQTQLDPWRSLNGKFWAYFPQPDGSVDAFETRVIATSDRADLALLTDHRRDQVAFLVADSIAKGDPVTSAGYPGLPNRMRGKYDMEVVEIKKPDGSVERHVVPTLITGDPHRVQGKIDVYVTQGVFSGFGEPSAGDSIGRRVFHTAAAWAGNSGGPLLTIDRRVVGIQTWGVTQAALEGNGTDSVNFGTYLPDHLDELRRLHQ